MKRKKIKWEIASYSWMFWQFVKKSVVFNQENLSLDYKLLEHS